MRRRKKKPAPEFKVDIARRSLLAAMRALAPAVGRDPERKHHGYVDRIRIDVAGPQTVCLAATNGHMCFAVTVAAVVLHSDRVPEDLHCALSWMELESAARATKSDGGDVRTLVGHDLGKFPNLDQLFQREEESIDMGFSGVRQFGCDADYIEAALSSARIISKARGLSKSATRFVVPVRATDPIYIDTPKNDEMFFQAVIMPMLLHACV